MNILEHPRWIEGMLSILLYNPAWSLNISFKTCLMCRMYFSSQMILIINDVYILWQLNSKPGYGKARRPGKVQKLPYIQEERI